MLGLKRKRMLQSQQWYSLALDASQVDSYEVERLRLIFGALYMSAGMPDNMQLWLAQREDGGADLYLSPAATAYCRELCQKYQALACARPVLSNLFLVAGDQFGISSFTRGSMLHKSARNDSRQKNLPAEFSYRTLRRFNTTMVAAHMLFVDGQVSPYVQRYIQAWFPAADTPSKPEFRYRGPARR